MLRSLRELAFRLSLAVPDIVGDRDFGLANRTLFEKTSANWTQTVPYAGRDDRIAFLTNWAYVAASVVIGIMGVGSVLPLYNGWWRLGRSVTLNPLETATAFEAPLLRGVNSNAEAPQIAQEVGSTSVRYGVTEVVSEDDNETRLCFAHDVETPRAGMDIH